VSYICKQMNSRTLIIIIAALLLVLAPDAHAQHGYIGAMFGANVANLSFDENPPGITNSRRIGILAGIQVDHVLNGIWSLTGEALYEQQGANQSINRPGKLSGIWLEQTGTSSLTLNYLDVTALIKASFGSGMIKPYVFAGPSLGAYLSGNEKDNYTVSDAGASVSVDTTQSIPESSVKIDISGIIGAGVSFTLPSWQMLFIEGGYEFGITDILDDFGSEVQSRDIRLAAGILFPLD